MAILEKSSRQEAAPMLRHLGTQRSGSSLLFHSHAYRENRTVVPRSEWALCPVRNSWQPRPLRLRVPVRPTWPESDRREHW